MPSGTIARLLIDKGFGFIRDESGVEHFFHRSAVRGAVFELLREGQRVEFAVEESPKGPRAADVDKMLATVGAASLDELIAQTVPASILDTQLDLPPASSEVEVIDRLREISSKNRVVPSLIGLGYHDTILPPVIQRNVLENPAWYTAYTSYQPEISQGRLEALLNFQTMVSDLTALDIANASLLDEPTAAAEAMSMARRLVRDDRHIFYLDPDCHPATRSVMGTRAGAGHASSAGTTNTGHGAWRKTCSVVLPRNTPTTPFFPAVTITNKSASVSRAAARISSTTSPCRCMGCQIHGASVGR